MAPPATTAGRASSSSQREERERERERERRGSWRERARERPNNAENGFQQKPNNTRDPCRLTDDLGAHQPANTSCACRCFQHFLALSPFRSMITHGLPPAGMSTWCCGQHVRNAPGSLRISEPCTKSTLLRYVTLPGPACATASSASSAPAVHPVRVMLPSQRGVRELRGQPTRESRRRTRGAIFSVAASSAQSSQTAGVDLAPKRPKIGRGCSRAAIGVTSGPPTALAARAGP